MMTDSNSYTVANRDHFDLEASKADSASSLELARRSALAIRKVYPFDEDTTEVMDFACGKGLLSSHLLPHVKSILGVDISQNMVDIYNTRVQNQGIAPEDMWAVCADLQGVGGELEGRKFDIVVCASAYHHFPSIENTTRTLTSFLKPRGVLIVLDLHKAAGVDLDEVFPHGHGIVAHQGGFKEDEIKGAFEAAGLEEFGFRDAVNVKKKGIAMKLFVATGVKR
ncbi:S-adenosyl-L-methionine-dependent methyltransferase [Cyathus striatus]|nr:S-adenosyl-L-methionine-dependent methyltransferase [Cyathus striatus]